MGTKINALPQVVTPVGTDELPISQDTGSGSRITYKATLDQIKNYVKNTGGGTGSVTSVGVNSTDGSISVFGSPVVGAGTITLNISSVGLDKLDDGGATNGQVLTYNGSTTTWVASEVPKELPSTATNGQVLTYNGSTSTWVASADPSAAGGVSGSPGLSATYGYQIFASGAIMQWGLLLNPSGNHTVTLPVSFSTSQYLVFFDDYAASTNSNTVIISRSTTNFIVDTNSGGGKNPVSWMAIGY